MEETKIKNKSESDKVEAKRSVSTEATADKPASAEASAGKEKKSKKEIVIMIVAAIMLLLAGVLIGWAFLSVDEVDDEMDGDQDEDQTTSQDTSDEQTESEIQLEICTSDMLGIELGIPDGWECELRRYPADTGEDMKITKENIIFYIGSINLEAIGYDNKEIFHENENVIVNKHSKADGSYILMGHIKDPENPQGVYKVKGNDVVIDIAIPPNNDRYFTTEEMLEIQAILKSIKIIKSQQTTTSEIENTLNVTINEISQNDAIQSPLEFSGNIAGGECFEGDCPVEITDLNGNILGSGFLFVTDWMTDQTVDYTCEIEFDPQGNDKGYLVIKNTDPSGLEEINEFQMPVQFGQ